MTYAGMSVDEILKSLENGIRDFMQTDRYKDYLRAVGRFHDYSTNNIALITMQRPDATLVAGYTTWKNAFNRSVKKGEKGIRIIAPYPVKIEKEKDVFDAYGNLRREKVTVTVPRFRCVSVFDVSQTEGDRLPELEPAELNKEVDGYSTMIKALERTSRVPVSYREIKGGARGFYDASVDRITIKSGMGQSQTVKTLIHEIAHSFLHGKVNGGALMPAGTKEVEAESVAYTVCSAFGIDTSEYTFPYVTAWAAKVDDSVLRDSMDRIRETSSELIYSLSDNIREVRKEAEISELTDKIAPVIMSSYETLQSKDAFKIRVSEMLAAGRAAPLLTELRKISMSEKDEDKKTLIGSLISRTEAFAAESAVSDIISEVER